ncbi:MAG: ATP-binding protein [Thermodesulfobacteriota bacterium]
MRFSLRTRLTLWYTMLLGISLIVFGTTLYYSLFKVFTDNIDDQIESVSGMMVHAVIGPTGRLILPRNFDIILERFFGIKTTGNYIQILDHRGTVQGKSSSLEGFILPLSEKGHQNALKGISTYEVVDTIGRFPVRTITKPVIFKTHGLVAIIQVGSSLEGIEKIFTYIVYVFFIGGVISVIIASAVGWFLARKALKPVVEITTIARRIGAESLNERLVVDGPSDEIGRLAATFNEMIERLEKSFKQVVQFTGDASHELKTPLTVMQGEIEVSLRTETTVEGFKEVLVSALEEIGRMNNIVTNLLDLAKADVDGLSSVREPVRLDNVLIDTYELLQKVALEKGLTIDIVENEPITVMGDKLRLGQLVFNLMDNAIKYTPAKEDGRIDISLTIEDNFARLVVRDTGIGISSDEIGHIFDRFYRVDKARTREAGGTGLGLNICKVIVDSMDGTITAASEPDLGSEFIVLLPALGDVAL